VSSFPFPYTVKFPHYLERGVKGKPKQKPVSSETFRRATDQNAVIAPHRSYRRVVVEDFQIILAFAVLALIEAGLLASLSFLINTSVRYASWLLTATGVPNQIIMDSTGWPRGSAIDFSMPVYDFRAYAAIIVAGALATVALVYVKKIIAPIRQIIILHFIVITISAGYLLLVGDAGYEALEFSQLYVHAIALTWLVIPVFIGISSLVFPFNPFDRIALTLICLVWDIIFATFRYAIFLLILAHSGAVTMAGLYLIYGPLLDCLPIIAILSLFLVRLSHRIRHNGESWSWL
jgi:hypothetical protein